MADAARHPVRPADRPAREPVALVDAKGGRSPFAEGHHRIDGLEVAVSTFDDAGGTRIEWRVRNPSREAVALDRLGLEVATPPGRVLEHGWQSWSVVRRCDRDDASPARRRSPRWRSAMLLADPPGAGRIVAGDQFLLDEAGVTGFLSAESHLGTVTAAPDRATAWALLDGALLPGGAERVLDPVWIRSGDAGQVYSRFAERWGERAGGRIGASTPSGWCSWYRYLRAVTPDDVRRAARSCRRHGLSVVQIDDGHQAAIGHWTAPSAGWAGGVAQVAGELRDAGLAPGIWTAPFLASERAPLLRANPETVVRDDRGRPLGAMHHPEVWGGWAYALDTTHPAVLDALGETFAELAGLGFTYHKLDFLYAGALAGHRHDRHATRAEALRRGLDTIRRAIGERAFMVACGCPLGPAVGLCDAMRVSTDVGRWWSEPATVRGYPETQSGLRNAVRASVLRAPLHRRLWLNDPDCVLLEPGERGLSPRHRVLMTDVVAGTGGFTMLSDDLDTYGTEEWAVVDRLSASSAGDGPLDLVDPFADVVTVRSPASVLEVDWRGEGRSRRSARAGRDRTAVSDDGGRPATGPRPAHDEPRPPARLGAGA